MIRIILTILVFITGKITMAAEYNVKLFSFEEIDKSKFEEIVLNCEVVEFILDFGYMDRRGSFRQYRLFANLNKKYEYELKCTMVSKNEDGAVLIESPLEIGGSFYLNNSINNVSLRFYLKNSSNGIILTYEEDLIDLVTQRIDD